MWRLPIRQASDRVIDLPTSRSYLVVVHCVLSGALVFASTGPSTHAAARERAAALVASRVVQAEQASAFGEAIVATPDLDGDGVEDLAIGAPRASGPDGPTGAVVLVSTATGAPLGCVFGRSPARGFGRDIGVVRGRDQGPTVRLFVVDDLGSAELREFGGDAALWRVEQVIGLLGVQPDQDGDGWEEVVVERAGKRTKYVATLSGSTGLDLPGLRLERRTHWIEADLDGDGLYDLVDIPSAGRVGLTLRSGATGAAVSTSGRWNVEFTKPEAVGPVAADLTGDGQLDLAIGLTHGVDGGLSIAISSGGRAEWPAFVSKSGATVPWTEKQSPRGVFLDRRLYAVGDVNGDEVDDLLSCKVGTDDGDDLECLSGRDAAELWAVRRALFGSTAAVAIVGDCDGDDVNDIAVACRPRHDIPVERWPDGQVFILSGRTGVRLRQIDEALIPLTARNADTRQVPLREDPDDVLRRAQARGIGFAHALVAVNDMDGDGLSDIAIGAPWAYGPNGRRGAVLYVSAATGARIACTFGGSSDEWLGIDLGIARAVDSERPPRLIVNSRQGTAQVRVCGDESVRVHLGAVVSEILGSQRDLDGDGYEEIVVASMDRGARLVKTLSTSTGLEIPGHRISGQARYLDHDMNGDGLRDFAEVHSEEAVRLSVLSGHDGTSIAVVPLDIATATPLGGGRPMVGDLNVDGKLDLVIGMVQGRGGAGALVVAYGGEPSTLAMVPKEVVSETQPYEHVKGKVVLPRRFLAIGDVDADGADDVLAMQVDVLDENDLECVAGRDGRLLWRAQGLLLKSQNALAIVGDCDGDGINDLAVAKCHDYAFAPCVDGAVSIVSARTGELIRRIEETSFPELSLDEYRRSRK